MASHEDLDDWSFEDGPMNAAAPDVMLASNEQVDLPLLMAPQKRSSETASYMEEMTQDRSLMYDSCESPSDDSSDSDSEDEDTKPMKTVTYHNGADLNAVPIQRDGMAVCEKCGAIGVKHAFYSKSKRFCSLACSRSYAMLQREGKPIPKPEPKLKFQLLKVKTKKKQTGDRAAGRQKSKLDLSRSFDWQLYMKRTDFQAAPVSCFTHVPLFDCWDNIAVGMKVEVENKDCENVRNVFPKAFWIATVTKIAGYKSLLRYEGFGTDNSKDFWVNLCTEIVHPVGWCATQGKQLIPPKTIQHKYTDWKEFLVKRLTGARTLPNNFYQKTQDGLKSQFHPGMQLEVVDKNRISSMRVATIDEVIGGRLHVNYIGAELIDEGFWCHERSPLIHPVGWSQVVGHSMQASLEYAKRSLQKTLLKKYEEHDTTWDMFLPQKQPAGNLKFKEGMKLEAIDPLNLATICVATVTKVLRNNYLMVGIDGYTTEKGADSFCYHASSSCIFPVGFCEINGITLTPPRGHKGEFKWFDYLKETNSIAAPVALFNKELPNHGFKSGMCLEAVDLMEPRLICVGTIAKVVGRLLRVHFDGWADTYDQWCDCETPDLYPVGWCEMVGYHLEPPRSLDFSGRKKKGRKPKTQIYRGPRKKKKMRTPPGNGGNNKRPKVNGKTGSAAKLESRNTNDGQLSYMSVLNSNSAGRRRTSSTSSSDDTDQGMTEESSSEATMSSRSGHEGNVRRPLVPSVSPNFTPAEARQEVIVFFNATGKTIPRLIDFDPAQPALNVITSELWTIFDVGQFLRVNDCGAYCESFSRKKIDGRKFLTLTKEQIVNLTGMKVGPSLKIYDLIQQLKAKVQISS